MTTTWSATLWHDDITPADHTTEGRAQLLFHLYDKPRMLSIMDAFLDECDSVEDLAYAVLVGRSVYTAIGEQLDTLGKLVGQERGEMVDDEYRIFILVRILVNRSRGRRANIVHILEMLELEDVHIDSSKCVVRISVVGAEHGDIIGELVSEAVAGGVQTRWVYSEKEETEVFAWSSTLGVDEVDSARGFGDLGGVTQTTGGYLSGGHVR